MITLLGLVYVNSTLDTDVNCCTTHLLKCSMHAEYSFVIKMWSWIEYLIHRFDHGGIIIICYIHFLK